jgi:hypothetical protein
LIRINAKDHPAGARRKIAPMRFGYPRYVGKDKGPLFAKENLEKGLFPWNETVPLGTFLSAQPASASGLPKNRPLFVSFQSYSLPVFFVVGYIPEVKHTYSYLDATYGIVNEHGRLSFLLFSITVRSGAFCVPRVGSVLTFLVLLR